MTRSNHTPLPTDSELRILGILWDLKQTTARAIHERLNADAPKPRVVTTTMKLLEIMMGKGLVKRDESTWPHQYRANVAREVVRRRLASHTLTNVFDQSASQFMLAALESGAVGPSEIAEIRAMLETYERERDNA